jgi:hypothetical protein
MRHSVNLLMKARGRPHNWQRLCACTLKRGGRFDLMIMDFLATVALLCEVRQARLAAFQHGVQINQ